MPVLGPTRLTRNRVEAIRNYHKAAGIPKAELDVSGGVDSAVMLGLLSQALGPDNVAAVYSSIDSSLESQDRAEEVCEVFGVHLIKLELSDVYADIQRQIMCVAPNDKVSYSDLLDKRKADPTIDGGFRSCLRAPIGRYINRLLGGIRHGTGNEDEDRWLRFFQKGGDGEVDTNPIEMLSKGEVWQLARFLGVPESICKAQPTPDLWAGQIRHTDEEEIRKYLGLETFPLPMYSAVEAATNDYLMTGFIERVNRLLDTVIGGKLGSEILFSDQMDGLEEMARCFYTNVVRFSSANQDEIVRALLAARRAERITRHKINDNIPTLGTRKELVDAGILSNEIVEPGCAAPICDRQLVGFSRIGVL